MTDPSLPDSPETGGSCSPGPACGDAAAQQAAGDVREAVRQRYAAAALHVTDTPEGGCCSPALDSDSCSSTVLGDEGERFGAALYAPGEHDELPDTATLASLGCGNPTAVAELHEGEVVLDLGSGGGVDILLSARRVGPAGKAYGLDMTDEMLALARENQRKAGVENVEWLRGHIEDIPLPADSVDVVISNCVINLSSDKPRVLAEATRVLRAGGRLAVTDVIADPDMDAATRADMQAFTGCIAGALTRAQFGEALTAAGLVDVEIAETHRVHDHAGSAIVRARKPDPGCCDTGAQGSCCEPAAKSDCCGSAATAGGSCSCQSG